MLYYVGWIVIAVFAFVGCALVYATHWALFKQGRNDREYVGAALFGACAVLTFCFVAFLISRHTDNDPVFTLREREWSCTAAHQVRGVRPQMIGKVTMMVPYTNTVCDQYTRRR